MAKEKNNPYYVLTRRIYPTQYEIKKINKTMEAANRLYNMGVTHYSEILDILRSTPRFMSVLGKYLKWLKDNTNEGSKKNPYLSEISAWIKKFGLQEYDLHAWFAKTANTVFPKCMNIDIVQKLATNLYSALKKVIFSSGKNIHYRKFGQTDSIEGKRNQNAIIYHPKTDTVRFAKKEIKIQPIRAKDFYMQEALATGKVKYCRLIRKPFKTGYKYFVQLIMSGPIPQKFKVNPGVTGQDPGISNSSYYGDNIAGFVTLSKGCEKYEKQIRDAAVKYERRRRLANPENYNPDGTIKRGVKLRWKRTKGIQEALFELKNAYRLKAEHTKNYNGRLSNQIVRETSVLKQETMDYRALQKRSKVPAERSEKESIIKNKMGETKAIHKFKKKKRFGSSICRRAPGAFDKMLRDKTLRYGGFIVLLDPRITASSQTDHTTGTRTKMDLSQRTKIIAGQLVQRDLYAAFLNDHTMPGNTLDIEACKKDFPLFLKRQAAIVDIMRLDGDLTGNFGLSDFV